uniref:Uncharacterized protein n=1 Tax=Oryza barthii TaxID=65489 RepID=A0A0D3GHF2_9ORYZ
MTTPHFRPQIVFFDKTAACPPPHRWPRLPTTGTIGHTSLPLVAAPPYRRCGRRRLPLKFRRWLRLSTAGAGAVACPPTSPRLTAASAGTPPRTCLPHRRCPEVQPGRSIQCRLVGGLADFNVSASTTSWMSSMNLAASSLSMSHQFPLSDPAV